MRIYFEPKETTRLSAIEARASVWYAGIVGLVGLALALGQLI